MPGPLVIGFALWIGITIGLLVTGTGLAAAIVSALGGAILGTALYWFLAVRAKG